MSIPKLFEPPAVSESEAGERNKNLTLCAQLYLSIREKRDEQAAKLKELNEKLDTAELAMLQALDNAGLKTIKLESGASLTSAERHVFALPNKTEPAERAKALAWLRRVGAKAMVELSINANSLGAFCRQRMDGKLPISPLIKTTVLRCLSVRQ